MFKKLFIDSIKNPQWLKISLIITLLVFSGLLICFFLTNEITTISIWILVLAIISILGNWISNVMIPRGKLKKSIPLKYENLSKEYNSKIELKSFAENYIHAKGFAFTILALIPTIVIVIFIVI